MKELYRGAEAVIYEVDDKILLKRRVRKGYRIKPLDLMLRRTRTKLEAMLMRRAGMIGVNVPVISELEEFSFKMTYLHGEVLRDYVSECRNLKDLFAQVGRQISNMHEAGIVHGDLTTSNMILVKGKVYFIDFSLGSLSNKIEDKAVDLHLIKQALIAKHNKVWRQCFNAIVENYRLSNVLNRLKAVEKRGRKK